MTTVLQRALPRVFIEWGSFFHKELTILDKHLENRSTLNQRTDNFREAF